MKKVWKLTGEVAKKAACREVLSAPEGHVVTLGEPNRTLDQNAAQWPLLEALAKQSKWSVNGVLDYITADDWKDVLTCAFKNEQVRIAQGYSGGMVLLGQRTSKFGKKDFSDWLEFLWSVVNERGVVVYQEAAA